MWKARPYHIKKGAWCPYCQCWDVNEEKCRFILESLTGTTFPKDWDSITPYQLERNIVAALIIVLGVIINLQIQTSYRK